MNRATRHNTVDMDRPRDHHLEHHAHQILHYAQDLHYLLPALVNIHRSMEGHPKSASTENDRTSGQTTVTDDNDVPMPAVSDPTGEAAIRAHNRAVSDLDTLMMNLPEASRLLRAVANVVCQYRDGSSANTRPTSMRDDPSACEHHAELGIYEPVYRVENPAGNLPHKMRLCRACHRRVHDAGRLPSRRELEHRLRTGKFPPLHAA